MLMPARWSALDVELHAFKVGRTVDQGGLGKEEHFWKVTEFLYGKNNLVGNTNKYFLRNPWSDEMIYEACRTRYLGVGGPANCSKSETFAMWLLVTYLSDARHTLGGILSTTKQQARKRIWGSLVDFIRAVPAGLLPLKVADSLGIIRYQSATWTASDRASLFLIAAERSKEQEAIGQLIGMHNDNVIIIADELSELVESILTYAFPGGNLTSNPKYQLVGLANPPGYYDPFAKLWKPKDGWMSISVDSARWETEHGVGLHFDAMQSPNLLAGHTVFPFLPTQEKINDALKAEGGERSASFWRMMRGFPNPSGSEDLIYAESDIVKYRGDEPAIWGDEPLIRVSMLDPGFTNGGDKTVMKLGYFGKNRDGVLTLGFDKEIELYEDVTNKKENRSEQIAKQFGEINDREGVTPHHAAVDATGAGDPFCDVVDIKWKRGVLRVKFGGAASELPVSLTDPTKGKDRYYNRVAEIWYSGVELLRQGQLKGITPKQAKQMSARKLMPPAGKPPRIRIESKEDMKLRTQESPDYADCGFVGVALCRERLGFTAAFSRADLARGKRKTGWRAVRKRLGNAEGTPQNL